MSIDPDKLMAFVDGELEGAERHEVEQAIAADPGLRAEVDRQRGLRATLAGHYGPVATQEVPDRLRALLGAGPNAAADVATVVSLEEARERRRGLSGWPTAAAIAASLVIGVIAGQLILIGSGDPIATKNGRLVAQDGLAEALETQLASAPPAMAQTHIGLTFMDTQGRPCRTFENRAFAGLACRGDGRWQVVMTAATETAGQPVYRQAGSSPVMETAQAMMASEPFDPGAERAAVQGGWKISRR
jgi:anti-sigma factor RsiW